MRISSKRIVLKLLTLTILQLNFVLSANSTEHKIPSNNSKNTIFFVPFNLFDLQNPSIQMAYERKFNKHIGIQIEFGYIINHNIQNYILDRIKGIKGDEYTNSGLRLKIELKYILRKVKGGFFYTSIDLYYTQNKSGVDEAFSVSDSTFKYSTYRPPGTNAYYDFFINDMKKYGTNLKTGLKIFFGRKKFVVEPNFGLGIAYRMVKQYERENINDKLLYNDDPLSWNHKNGNMWDLGIEFDVKIGYRF